MNDWLAIIALAIALIGGIPGILGIIDYWKRTSIKIDFDHNQSMAGRIYSSNHSLNGKLALLIYRITITGSGLKPAYFRDINLVIKLNNRWIEGRRFIPK